MNKSVAIVIYFLVVLIAICSLYNSMRGTRTTKDLISNSVKLEIKKKKIKEGDVETWVYWME